MSGCKTRILVLALLALVAVRPATAKTSFMELFNVFPVIDANDQDFGAVVRSFGGILRDFTAYLDACKTDDKLFKSPKARAALTERSKAFVDLARRYETKGDDCRAVLRRKIVAHLARATLGMAAIFDEQISRKLPKEAAIDAELDAERAQLISEVSVCREQQARERL